MSHTEDVLDLYAEAPDPIPTEPNRTEKAGVLQL